MSRQGGRTPGTDERLRRHRQGGSHRRFTGFDPGVQVTEFDAVPGTGECARMPARLDDSSLIDLAEPFEAPSDGALIGGILRRE